MKSWRWTSEELWAFSLTHLLPAQKPKKGLVLATKSNHYSPTLLSQTRFVSSPTLLTSCHRLQADPPIKMIRTYSDYFMAIPLSSSAPGNTLALSELCSPNIYGTAASL
jgi:hypothetical protein